MAKVKPVLIQPGMLARPANLRNYVDIEWRLNMLPPFTMCLILMQLATFLWSGYTYSLNPNDNLLIEGQFQGYWIHEPQGWLRVVSATFLHAGFMHIAGNLLMFYAATVMLEHLFGSLTVFKAYGVALAAQAVGSYMYFDDKTATVGASGAVFGMVGFLIAFYFRYRNDIFVRHRSVGIVFAVLSLHLISLGLSSKLVNNAAHIGGFVGGLAFGFYQVPFFVTGVRPVLEKRTKILIMTVTVLFALLPLAFLQRNLSATAPIRLKTQARNFWEFLMGPGGVQYHEISYWTYTKKIPREMMNEGSDTGVLPDDPRKDGAKDKSKGDKGKKDASSGAGGKDAKGDGDGDSGNEDSDEESKKKLNDMSDAEAGKAIDKANQKGQEQQGHLCKRCVEGEPCDCKPECRWTYFHHYQDSECRIKVKTTIWGPNTGSPFRKGFDSFPCHEAEGRYYRWEHPRENCFAPDDSN